MKEIFFKIDEIALNGLASPENPTHSRENGVDGRVPGLKAGSGQGPEKARSRF
jgi:hypothetical protein